MQYTTLQKALRAYRNAEQLVADQRLRVAALERSTDTKALDKAKRLLVILSDILAEQKRALEAAEHHYHDADTA